VPTSNTFDQRREHLRLSGLGSWLGSLSGRMPGSEDFMGSAWETGFPMTVQLPRSGLPSTAVPLIVNTGLPTTVFVGGACAIA